MPYSHDHPLLMIPGPVSSQQNVLDATAARSYAHTEQAFVSGYQTALQNLRSVFDTSEEYSPLVVAGGGTLAMEIAMINLLDQNLDEKILICETGYFGDRFVQMAERFGIDYTKLSSPLGQGISEEDLADTLETGEFDYAFIQHVDTSTGVANDIEMFGRICAEQEVISVVDGVCALGGQELHQERWEIDIYFSGAQKALALPPGLAVLMYSPTARNISERRDYPFPSYYADLNNWWPVMDAYLDGRSSYFSTPATNLIMGLAQSTENLLEEGMDAVYGRHQKLAERFREEMQDLGFEFVTDEQYFANTLSTPKYLDPQQGTSFRAKLLEKGVLVAGGIQSGIANTYFRVGHMGIISDEQIDFTLQAIKSVI